MTDTPMTGELRFDDRVAIVTGAGGGLGRAHARLLAARGARVVVNDLGGPRDGLGDGNPAMAEAVAAEITAAGGTAIANAGSVAERASADALVAQALDTWGRVDVVVNNAGITGLGNFAEPESYLRVYATHLVGTVNVLRAVWPHFLDRDYGRVVNTTSGSVFGAAGSGDYAAAKGGVFAFSRNLAQDHRNTNITVNAIMPIAFTRMTAAIPHQPTVEWLERWFAPEKVSPFVAVLAHESVPCTGETFTVGGGRAAHVVFAHTKGFFDLDATPESYRDHFDAVMADDDPLDTSGFAEFARYSALLPDPFPIPVP
jgi:NAD(P)-dependent dehydrogenase (short-subunit alcohol dehydrogenase family)